MSTLTLARRSDSCANLSNRAQRSGLTQLCTLSAALLAVAATHQQASASDWPRFRGPNGTGVSPDAAAAPVEWSSEKNLKWSVDLPGKGVSCPIIVGDKVFVTCWTGEGAADLKRQLVCYDRQSGKKLWEKESIPVAGDNESHDGMFTQTGYAAHTPVSDGENVFCFYGVSGVLAYDMNGDNKEPLWQKSVGADFGMNHWGTASSPILYKDTVIVTASSESKTIFALDKQTGEEKWKCAGPELNGTWSTPILVDLKDGKQELVIDVTGELWGIDPDTGKKLWTCQGTDPNSACASLVADGDVVYSIVGRRGGNSLAVRAGGEGDVAATHVVWKSNQRGSIGTPVLHDGLLYWMADGVANCITAADHAEVYKERLQSPAVAAAAPAAGAPAAANQGAAIRRVGNVDVKVQLVQAQAPAQEAAPADAPRREGNQNEIRPQRGFGRPGEFGPPGGGGGQGGGGGRGGRGNMFRSADYTSPVIADGKIYFVRRGGEVFVLSLGKEYKVLAVNKFAGEGEDFSATPAVADGQLYIRSSKKLYCIANAK